MIQFDSVFKEFFEPGLEDGVHLVRLPADRQGVDVAAFKNSSGGRAGGGCTHVRPCVRVRVWV